MNLKHIHISDLSNSSHHNLSMQKKVPRFLTQIHLVYFLPPDIHFEIFLPKGSHLVIQQESYHRLYWCFLGGHLMSPQIIPLLKGSFGLLIPQHFLID